MNKKTNTRLKVEAAEWVPQSLDEVSASILGIGELQRERDRIQADMNGRLARIRVHYEARAKPNAERIAKLTRGVATWCEAHRDELTHGGKTKTARLATGDVSWRMRPPSVVVRGLSNVIAWFKANGLTRFLRVKEELDKEAILADPEAVEMVKGLSISQREDFVVKPFSTELEEVR